MSTPGSTAAGSWVAGPWVALHPATASVRPTSSGVRVRITALTLSLPREAWSAREDRHDAGGDEHQQDQHEQAQRGVRVALAGPGLVGLGQVVLSHGRLLRSALPADEVPLSERLHRG